MADSRASAHKLRNCALVVFGSFLLCAAGPGVPDQVTKPPAAPPPTHANLDTARLAITGDVEKPLSLSLTDLGGFPRMIVKVVSEHSSKE